MSGMAGWWRRRLHAVGTVTMSTSIVAVVTVVAGCGVGQNTVPTEPSSTSSLSTAPPTPPSATGVFGLVTAGPTCPVERPDQPCQPRPVDARIDARDASGAVVGTTRTDGSGRYSLSLAPGVYTLTTDTGAVLPTCPPVTVAVTADARVQADIDCDTGIR